MARLVGLASFWLPAMLLVGVFAHWPQVSPVPAGHGELKLSLAHLSERIQPCRRLSEAERADLPANMRAFEVCERARAPVRIVLELDGRLLLEQDIRPAGLHRDGRAYLFRAWSLPAGAYRLHLNLRDSARSEGFDRQDTFDLQLDEHVSALLRVGDGGASLHSAGLSSVAPP